MTKMKFKTGDHVFKPNGYPFPGTVVSAFLTMAGKPRYVVEHECGGMLHIFSGNDLTIGRAELGTMARAALQRPIYYERLDAAAQWQIDKVLGILDWDGDPSK